MKSENTEAKYGEENTLYYTQLGNSKICFNKTGIVIKTYSDETGDTVRKRKQRTEIKSKKWDIIFKNCTSNIKITPSNGQSHVHITTDSLGTNIRESTYKTITYTNVWPNIDLKFSLPEEGGVKYDLIIQPGANTDDISFQYRNIDSLSLDLSNNLLIQTANHVYKDYAPVAYVDGGEEVLAEYHINDNTVSIELGNYDTSKKLVIDPWLVNFGFFESGQDIEYDNQGNVYVSATSFVASNIYKYDENGNLIWTYDVPGNLTVSDISINRFTQELFLSIGQVFTNIGDVIIIKLDEFGNQVQTYNYIEGAPEELWRMKYDHCNNQLVFGTGGESYVFQGGTIDLDLGFMIGKNILDIVDEGNHDVNNLVFDPNGQSCYMLVASTAIYPTYDNILFKTNLPDISTAVWSTYSTHEFVENGTPFGLSGGSFNGIACGWEYLYTFDGARLIKWDKDNGALLDEVTVGVDLALTAGIFVTPCGDVYIGLENAIFVFDNDLNQINTIELDGICFDLVLGENNTAYACGSGFIEAFSIVPPPFELSSESDVCGQGVGSASITLCDGLTAVDVLWSPSGQTTHEATGLEEGWHTVSVIGNNCYEANSIQDSIYVSNTDANCELSITLDESTICLGECTQLIANVTSGVPPYTLQWDNGITEVSAGPIDICPLETTVYSVTVTDNSGETASAFTTIEVLPEPVVDIGNDTILCTETPLTLSANNPIYSYLWFDNSTEMSVEVTTSGSYWVTASNGACSISDTIEVLMISPNINMSSDTTLCEGQLLTLNVPNFETYQWSTGETNSSISISETGVYSVSVSNQGCDFSDSISVVFTKPNALFSSDVISGCPPLSIDFMNLSEGNFVSWLWDFGNGITSTLENPTSIIYNTTGQFEVSLEITDNNGCVGSTNIVDYITVFPSPVALFEITPEPPYETNQLLDFNNSSSDIESVMWDFGDGSFSTDFYPSHSFESPGPYVISLEVSNTFGCINQINWSVYIEQQLIIYVPTSFTPNNDGVNDFFKPVISGEDPERYSFEVFNRWGERIFQTKDTNIGWSGAYEKSSQKDEFDYYAINGNYTWVLTVRGTNSSKSKTITGIVTIIR